MADGSFDLARFPVHLGRDGIARVLPEMDGSGEWFERYGDETAADGVDGRLVSMYTFSESWSTWEVHPHGHELVLCVAGEIVLHQKAGDDTRSVTLGPGEAAFNDPGVWHTADVAESATVVFVTAGLETENIPR